MEHVRFDDTSSFNQGAEQEELERTALSFDSLEIMHEKWWFPDKDVLDIDDFLLKNEISSNQDVCTCAHIRCGSDGKATDPFVLKLSNAERQKRYRTRKKLKIADIQNDLNEKSAEYAALVAENIELKENNSALELLSEYALAMLNTITLSSLHRYRQISKLSEASLKFIKDLIGVVIGKLLYSQLTVGEFITVSDSLRDTGHRNYFFSSWLVYHANLLTEWINSPEQREGIENVLKQHINLIASIYQIANKWIYWYYANVFFKVTELAATIEAKYASSFRNPELLNAVRLSNKQYEAMLDAWYDYLAKYADLKATMICSLPDLKGSSMMNISNLRLFSQQKAQQHLSFHQISAILKKFEEEEWRIRADLVIKVSQLLSPLQAIYLRLVNISSSDVRTVFGIILGLEWDSSEALSTASRPSKFAEETLKALVLSGDT